jgi:cell wall-associated NlpC family hydrolase
MNKLLELVKPKLGCGYVWGTQGEVLTPGLLARLKVDFGTEHYDLADGTKASKWLSQQVFDCSGLIVWALRSLNLVVHNFDATAADLFGMCTPIGMQELRPGDLVFKQSGSNMVHVGVYLSDGHTIEAQGTALGVIVGSVSSFNMYGRLNFKLEDSTNPITKALLAKRVIKDPQYWDDHLVPGGMIKAEYAIIVLKGLLGIK